MNDRRSGKPDEQAVIAAVQLLVQSMEPSQREKLLSTLLRGQQKDVAPDEVETEETVYPIQPLLLTMDEHQRTAPPDEQPSPAASHQRAESSSERGRAGRLVEMYAALPFASASLRRAQWWTRLALSAILLCVLSLSTFVAYEVGLHAGAVGAAAQAPTCQAMEYIVLEGRDAPFISYPDNRVIVSNDNSVQYVHLVRTGNYFAGPDIAWHSVGSQDPQAAAQCMGGVRIMVLPLRH
jgi:hypothetical protein